ncbi:MAG: 4Fe-4S dicluster domain-containing protein [Candidatus Thermoplasmatota archaeon]
MKYIGEKLGVQKYELKHCELYLIEDRCKGCNFCIEFCPKKVLEESKRFNSKGYHPPELVENEAENKICVGCGFCSLICPEFAIFTEERKEHGRA